MVKCRLFIPFYTENYFPGITWEFKILERRLIKSEHLTKVEHLKKLSKSSSFYCRRSINNPFKVGFTNVRLKNSSALMFWFSLFFSFPHQPDQENPSSFMTIPFSNWFLFLYYFFHSFIVFPSFYFLFCLLSLNVFYYLFIPICLLNLHYFLSSLSFICIPSFFFCTFIFFFHFVFYSP